MAEKSFNTERTDVLLTAEATELCKRPVRVRPTGPAAPGCAGPT